jgi:hypothetical protein
MSNQVHAVAIAVAVDREGPLAGALILGPSGAGKSSIALCLVEMCPWGRSAVVADDAVVLHARAGRLFARGRRELAGLVEVRGYGPAGIRSTAEIAVDAAFELNSDPPRLPDRAIREFLAIPVPAWPLRADNAVLAAIRVRVILREILARNAASA